jgi:hypothetical protein
VARAQTGEGTHHKFICVNIYHKYILCVAIQQHIDPDLTLRGRGHLSTAVMCVCHARLFLVHFSHPPEKAAASVLVISVSVDVFLKS